VTRGFSNNLEDGRLLECGEETFCKRKEKKLRTIFPKSFSCWM